MTTAATIVATPALDALTEIVRMHGPIATVRVSSAQAHGRAKQYSYWGAARYELRLDRAGRVTHTACERACSDRRSKSLASADAAAIAGREGRLQYAPIGRVTEEQAVRLLRMLARPAPGVP